jgi:DNA-binding XRE family transcriptional regulator
MDKHMEEFRQLSLNIAHYRKRQGLTQHELAEAIGISHNHMAQIEAPNITRAFSIKILFDISNVLKVKTMTLFDFGE